MRFSTRCAYLVLSVLAASGVLAPTEPALAVAAPTRVAVQFSNSTATISWDDVPGSHGYGVTIRPLGVRGPYGQEEVMANNYTLPISSFPYYGRHKKGYVYQVCSFSADAEGPCTTVADGFYVSSQGDAVSADDTHSAAHKASSCLAKGGEAALVTAAGTGYMAALVSWIPGVDAISAADVAFATAKAGAGRFVACLAF